MRRAPPGSLTVAGFDTSDSRGWISAPRLAALAWHDDVAVFGYVSLAEFHARTVRQRCEAFLGKPRSRRGVVTDGTGAGLQTPQPRRRRLPSGTPWSSTFLLRGQGLVARLLPNCQRSHPQRDESPIRSLNASITCCSDRPTPAIRLCDQLP